MYSKIKFSGLPSTMASLQVAFTVKPGQAYWQAIDCINNHNWISWSLLLYLGIKNDVQACSPVCILGKEFLEYNLSGSGQIEKSLSWNTFIHESKNKLMSWQKFLWPRMWGYTWPGLTKKEYVKKNPR